jgi:hypothetical protein
LAIVLLRVCEKFGDFQKTECVRKQRYQAEGEKGEKKKQDACDSVMLTRWLDVRRSGHDVDVLYLTGGNVPIMDNNSSETGRGEQRSSEF